MPYYSNHMQEYCWRLLSANGDLPRKYLKAQLMVGAAAGSVVACHPLLMVENGRIYYAV
jgi:hypothetical protein